MSDNRSEKTDSGIDGSKMFLALRKRLTSLNLPASANAVYVGLHFCCDKDTGEFNANYSELARLVNLSRQSVWNGFNILVEAGLVGYVEDNIYKIAGYEFHRKNNLNYFRIPREFLELLPECVRRRGNDVICLALELFDSIRVPGAKPEKAKKNLQEKLGRVTSRIMDKLHMVSSVIQFWIEPNGVFGFALNVELFSDDQKKKRQLNGVLTNLINERFDEEVQTRPPSMRRKLQSLVMAMIKWGEEQHLDRNTLEEVTKALGRAMAWVYKRGEEISNPLGYFKTTGPRLLKEYLRSIGRLDFQ